MLLQAEGTPLNVMNPLSLILWNVTLFGKRVTMISEAEATLEKGGSLVQYGQCFNGKMTV